MDGGKAFAQQHLRLAEAVDDDRDPMAGPAAITSLRAATDPAKSPWPDSRARGSVQRLS
jgi:hypothetical protein